MLTWDIPTVKPGPSFPRPGLSGLSRSAVETGRNEVGRGACSCICGSVPSDHSVAEYSATSLFVLCISLAGADTNLVLPQLLTTLRTYLPCSRTLNYSSPHLHNISRHRLHLSEPRKARIESRTRKVNDQPTMIPLPLMGGPFGHRKRPRYDFWNENPVVGEVGENQVEEDLSQLDGIWRDASMFALEAPLRLEDPQISGNEVQDLPISTGKRRCTYSNFYRFHIVIVT